MLEVVGLSKYFKARACGRGGVIKPLDGAEMYVADGERVGIVGKSGAGKSTLANIVCGLARPSAGNVYIDEYPLYGTRGKYDIKLGKRVQLIPQQPYLSFDPMQRVGRGLQEIILVNGLAKCKKEAKAMASELFERVLLDSALMDRLPSQLSGGQVQRAAIARALAMRADVIISDEATAMLDTSSQAQIVEIFESISREDGIAILLISHDVGLVKSFADRIYMLSEGKFEHKGQQFKNQTQTGDIYDC